MLDPGVLILQSLQSCTLQFAASMAAFSRIFDRLGRPGAPKIRRASRASCRRVQPHLHGEAHAALAFGNAGRSACSLGRSPIRGTTNRGYLEKCKFALPPMRKPPFYPPSVLKPHAQKRRPPKGRKDGGSPWGSKNQCFFVLRQKRRAWTKLLVFQIEILILGISRGIKNLYKREEKCMMGKKRAKV